MTHPIPMPKPLMNLPDPAGFRVTVADWLEKEYQRARQQAGVIARPEDTFEIQRALARVFELFREYSSAFATLRKRVAAMQEETLVDAVGEVTSTVHDGGTGQPNQGLTVPDQAGDIRLSLDMTNGYAFDLDQLITVVALDAAEHWVFGEDTALHTLAESAIRKWLELGKFEPQVTKVKAYAGQVAREGDDGLAGVVSSAIRKTTTYKGVKLERKSQ